jgi:hypothetical protein
MLAAFAAFAETVGIALRQLPKDESEADARTQTARLAVADALGIPVQDWPVERRGDDGLLLIEQTGRKLRVQTARHKDVVVATTLCEVEST